MIKNIIVGLGALLLLLSGYYLFVLEDQGLTIGNQIVASQAEADTRDFLRRLNELKAIRLDTEVLTDDRFNSRIDYTTPVSAQIVGRENPFLPTN